MRGVRTRWRRVSTVAAVAVFAIAGCSSRNAGRPSDSRTSGADPVVVIAGDISTAGTPDASAATAGLVLSLHPTRVLTVGDNQYNTGSSIAFQKFFSRTWGRFKTLIRPTPGHHEYYVDRTARGYFSYFGAAANNATQQSCRASCAGYYSFDLGHWHLIALNTNHYLTKPTAICAFVACDSTSAQLAWLRADLAATTRPCVLAYWSDPRWSSGTRHGSNPVLGPVWQALYAAHTDLVVNGHEHLYERFAKQNPDGRADPLGIREITAGTGGNALYPFGPPLANSEMRNDTTHGVLELTLHADSYTWRFVAAEGTFTDSGTTRCNAKK